LTRVPTRVPLFWTFFTRKLFSPTLNTPRRALFFSLPRFCLFFSWCWLILVIFLCGHCFLLCFPRGFFFWWGGKVFGFEELPGLGFFFVVLPQPFFARNPIFFFWGDRKNFIPRFYQRGFFWDQRRGFSFFLGVYPPPHRPTLARLFLLRVLFCVFCGLVFPPPPDFLEVVFFLWGPLSPCCFHPPSTQRQASGCPRFLFFQFQRRFLPFYGSTQMSYVHYLFGGLGFSPGSRL